MPPQNIAVVGEIWELRESDKLALVVFVRAESPGRPEDLRVVPVYTDATALKAATNRDLIIPRERNSLGQSVLAASWNARGLNGSYLARLVGSVDAEVVEAVRAAEMACIIPGFDLGSGAEWLGRRPKGSGLARAQAFQLAQLESWDDLIQELSPESDGEILVLNKGSYSIRVKHSVFASELLPEIPDPIFITFFDGADAAFYGGGAAPGAGPPATFPACATGPRTAPTGAVFVSNTCRSASVEIACLEHTES